MHGRGPCDIEQERMRGQHFNQRDYKKFWYDAGNRPIMWPGITDDHLANIIKMVKRENWYSRDAEPWQRAAYNCAHMEMNRRNERTMGPQVRVNFDDHMIDAIKYSMDTMKEKQTMDYCNKEDNSYPMPDRPSIATESLPQYFGRKVKLYNGKKGIVVGIYHHEYSSEGMSRPHAQLRIKIEGKGTVLLNANQVELVEVLTVYAYQAKNGTIEWTSTNHKDATLKRKGLKRLPNATKYIDLDSPAN